MLAGQAGMPMPQQSPQDSARGAAAEAPLQPAGGCGDVFHERLADQECRHALRYLAGRSVTADLIATFRLGIRPA